MIVPLIVILYVQFVVIDNPEPKPEFDPVKFPLITIVPDAPEEDAATPCPFEVLMMFPFIMPLALEMKFSPMPAPDDEISPVTVTVLLIPTTLTASSTPGAEMLPLMMTVLKSLEDPATKASELVVFPPPVRFPLIVIVQPSATEALIAVVLAKFPPVTEPVTDKEPFVALNAIVREPEMTAGLTFPLIIRLTATEPVVIAEPAPVLPP